MYKYRNGGWDVEILENGDRTMTKIEDKDFEYPNSMDVKITDYCNIGCQYCHEMSTAMGKHGDLKALVSLLRDSNLPPGVEIAIGGGAPLTHPEIKNFLVRLRELGFVPNLTENQRSLPKDLGLLKELISEKLIFGLGISINNRNFKQIDGLVKLTPNIVFHMIAGVNTIKEFKELSSRYPEQIVLILGYKNFGFGNQYFSDKVEINLNIWKYMIPKLLGTQTISFDNLAIDQLAIKNYISSEDWDKLYQGAEFTHSMYIDAVQQKLAPTSTSMIRFDYQPLKLFFNDLSIRKQFSTEKNLP